MNRRLKSISWTTVHALFLIFFTFWIQRSGFIHWDEGELVWVNTFIKKQILKINPTPEKEDLVFINVAYENRFIPKLDDQGNTIGRIDITDRYALSKFFEALAKNDNHKYIFSDIRFEESSEFDSLLNSKVVNVKRMVNSYHYDSKNKKFNYPIIKVPKTGLSDYQGDFLMFDFIQHDSIPSTPLVIYDDLTGHQSEKKYGFLKIGDEYHFNEFVIDYRLRNYHVFANNNVSDSLNGYHVKYAHLGELLFVDSITQGFYLQDFLKDKFVVLADFEDRDVHETVVGDMPGAMIIVNAYLSLLNGDSQITWVFMLYMFVFYFFLSWQIVHPDDFIQVFLERRFPKWPFLQNLIELLGYFTILFLMSLISYCIFDKHISIIVVALYCKLIDWIIEMVYKRRKLSIN